jgi:hypothetical protein
MKTTNTFSVFDCSLARSATGRNCSNLRELLDAVHTVSDSVLEHHLLRCALDDYFELYEFPNDLARWCWDALGERILGEQIALIDPYQYDSFGAVRAAVAATIEERLWTLERIPWCRPGLELHWIESRLIAFDTGERVESIDELIAVIERMPLRSLFYHVHEACRRSGGESDDFSRWLELQGVDALIVTKLRAVDFYFLNLSQLRCELLSILRQHVAAPPARTYA